MTENIDVPPLWWSPTRGVIQADEDAYSTVRSAGWTLVAHLPADAVRLAATPHDTGVDATETALRRVLADRGYRSDDEPVAVLLARVLDQLGARSADPYGTGDGSYPEPNGSGSL